MLRLVLFLALLCSARAVSDDRLLRAIALVETGGHDMVGRAGEVTQWQLAPATVRQHGTLDPRVHLRWLRRQFARSGIDQSAFNLALAWNAGWSAVRSGAAPERSYLYARRVSALAE